MFFVFGKLFLERGLLTVGKMFWSKMCWGSRLYLELIFIGLHYICRVESGLVGFSFQTKLALGKRWRKRFRRWLGTWALVLWRWVSGFGQTDWLVSWQVTWRIIDPFWSILTLQLSGWYFGNIVRSVRSQLGNWNWWRRRWCAQFSATILGVDSGCNLDNALSCTFCLGP